ncbi:glycosyltransferase family 39 protein [bacterium]|nr:glycosyltransferase family 39 protein [bacterium]
MNKQNLTLGIIQTVTALLIAAAWAASIYFLSTLSNFELRTKLATLTVWTMHAATLSLVIGGVMLIRRAYQNQHPLLKRKNLLGISLVLFGLFLFVSSVVPRTNRIYFDEQIFEGIALSIAHTGKAYMINHGEAEFGALRSFAQEYNKQPAGFPYLAALGFRLFGADEAISHRLNNLCYVCSVLCLGLLAWVLTRSLIVSAYAAGFAAITPMFAIWSNTAATEPAATFFWILTALAGVDFARRQGIAEALFFSGALGLSLFMRPESALILGVLGIILIPQTRTLLRIKSTYLLINLAWLFGMVALAHLFAVRDEPWGSPADRFSLEIFRQNFPINSAFYFNNQSYPLVLSILAIFGLFARQSIRARCLGLVWFLSTWIIFLFFYAGSYEYGADVRFSILTTPALALLAAFGAAQIGKINSTLHYFIIGVCMLSFVSFLPLMRAIGHEAAEARSDVDTMREFAKSLPPRSFILSHVPAMWLVWGKNAAQLNMVQSDPDYVRDTLPERFPGGVYVHWGHWCNVPDYNQNKPCEAAEQIFEMQIYRRYQVDNHDFKILKIVKAKN